MDVIGFVFVALLVILGGVVAYLGDLLGRRLGKRRHTIGRLRPKHTAALGTFVAGMLATFVTIFVLGLISEPVRVMLLEGRQAKEQLETMKGLAAKAEADYNTLQGKLSSTESRLAAKEEQLSNQTAKLTSETKKVEQLGKDSARLLTQANKLRNEVAQFRSRLSGVTKDLSSLQSQYKSLQAQTASVRGNNAEFIKQNQQLSQKNLQLVQQNAQIEQRIADREKEIKELEKSVGELQAALENANRNFDERLRQNRIELEKANTELERAASDLSRAQSELSLLRQLQAGMERSFVDSRRNRIIYNRGDELGRVVIPPRQNQAEARTLFFALLQSASNDAEAKGAINPPNRGPSAGLTDLTLEGSQRTPEQQTESAIRQFSGKPTEQVAIATTIFNAFQSEFVPIVIQIFPNPVVYRQGQDIINTLIDGRLTEDQIANSIAEFVQKELSPKAIKDGMLPRIGRENPLGEIRRDQLVAMVQGIKQTGRNTRLTFYTRRDIRAAEPLDLEFRLR